MNWLKLFSNKTEPVVSNKNTIVVNTEPKNVWRNNMWVMTPEGVGVIFELKEPVRVHLVNTSTGETVADKLFDSSTIRQATYTEIPEIRRGISAERAAQLGYA